MCKLVSFNKHLYPSESEQQTSYVFLEQTPGFKGKRVRHLEDGIHIFQSFCHKCI